MPWRNIPMYTEEYTKSYTKISVCNSGNKWYQSQMSISERKDEKKNLEHLNTERVYVS